MVVCNLANALWSTKDLAVRTTRIKKNVPGRVLFEAKKKSAICNVFEVWLKKKESPEAVKKLELEKLNTHLTSAGDSARRAMKKDAMQ